jgi:hypothetical protein
VLRYLDHIALYRAIILYREGRLDEAYHANLGWCDATERKLLCRRDPPELRHPDRVVLPDPNVPIVLRPGHTFTERDVSTASMLFAGIEYGRDSCSSSSSSSSSDAKVRISSLSTSKPRPSLLRTDAGRTHSPALRSLVDLASCTTSSSSNIVPSLLSSSTSISSVGAHPNPPLPPTTATRTGLVAMNHFVNTAVRFADTATSFQSAKRAFHARVRAEAAKVTSSAISVPEAKTIPTSKWTGGREPLEKTDRSKPNLNPRCPMFPDLHGPMRSCGSKPPYNIWKCWKHIDPANPSTPLCLAEQEK